jgi:hypothetical protein
MRDKAWRRQQRNRIINRHLSLLRVRQDDRYSTFTLARGRLAKRDPYDCGKTRCGVCHPHKRLRGNYKYSHRIRKEPLDLILFTPTDLTYYECLRSNQL